MAVKSEKRPYIKVFVFLAAFTAVEVLIATLAIAKLTQVVLLLSLAVGKALLVAMFYMHLRYDDRRLLLIAVSPLIMASVLMLIIQPLVSYGSFGR